MFNAGVRGKRAKDGVGFLSAAEQFNQKSFLVPTVTSFSVTDVSYVPLDNTAVDTAGGETIVINGSGFAPGATVQVGATTIGSVTYIDQGRLAFAAPALSSGSYTIYVTNSNGGTGILVSGLVYSGLPTFSTSAGSLGTVYETANINTSVVATGDAPITYSLLSGTLPSGATLNSNGTITGNAPADGSSTTYSFTIQASDGQLQDSTRAFTLTINTDVLTWSLANNTVYALDGVAMSNVTLSATSTANSNSAVTFAANTLPTGVSLSGNTIFGTPTVEQTVYSALTATATQTGRTATRFVSWVVSVSDAFFKNTTLAINSETSSNSTFVKDASTNNFAVSIFGDTKPNNFNPYMSGYYSNYFDGSIDNLTIANNSALNLSGGDFTIEAWIYLTALPAVNGSSARTATIAQYGSTTTGQGYEFNVDLTTNTLALGSIGTGNSASASFTFNLGAWYHVAVSRSSGTDRLFVNGVSLTLTTNTFPNNSSPSGFLRIGAGRLFTSYDHDFPGYISNLRIVKGTGVYTSSFTPSTTPLTAIANTSLLTCQSDRVVDNSTNNFSITRNGDVSISSFDPFILSSTLRSYGSAFFDGTGDYLSVASNAAFVFGTGNFTLEAWVYPTAAPSSPYGTIIGNGGDSNITSNYNVQLYLTTGLVPALYVGTSGTQSVGINASSAILANTWNHIAVTRSGNTFTLWVNGVSSATGTSSVNLNTSQDLYVGRTYSDLNNRYFVGYMTDARIVKGTAVYTTNFTPPSTPLTAISGTSLLTLQNNQPVNNNVFLDNSTNNSTITKANNVTQGTFSPYGGNWSNYFDGSSNLSYPVTSAFTGQTFTIEGWVNFTRYSPLYGSNSYACILVGSDNGTNGFEVYIAGSATSFTVIGFLARGGGTVTVNVSQSFTFSLHTWYHVAVVKSGNSYTFYVNGTSIGTSTSAGTWTDVSTLYVGYIPVSGFNEWMYGYISNVRVVTGTVVYTSNFTPSTTPLTPIANTRLLTCADNRFIDDSVNNYTASRTGTPTVQRFSPFSPVSSLPTSYSGYFDGGTNRLTTSGSSAFNLSGTSITLECWVYMTAAPSVYNRLITIGPNNAQSSLYLGITTGRVLEVSVPFASGGGVTSGANLIPLNTWTHLAFVLSSGTGTIYINGTQVGQTTGWNITSTNSNYFYVGYDVAGSVDGKFTGYVSNSRLVRGTAVYTSAFTPSTTPLTAISGTSILTLQSPTFIDNSTNNFTITAVGNSRPTQQNPFGFTSALTDGYTANTVGGSAYFDGTGDWLTLPYSPVFGLKNSYTIEAWVNPANVSTWKPIFSISATNTGFFGAVSLVLNSATLYAEVRPTTGGTLTTITGGTVVANAWQHVALSVNNTSGKLFLNGVQVGSTTTLTDFSFSAVGVAIGVNANLFGTSTDIFNGYISDLRVTTGTALYTNNFVPPVTPLTATQNTVLLNNFTNAAIADYSTMNNMETVGDAKISTAVSKFGGSSMFFDGTGDSVSASRFLAIGTGDFTVETWFYLTAAGDVYPVIVQAYDLTFGPIIRFGNNGFGNKLQVMVNPADLNTIWSTSLTQSAALNTWYHVALVRQSGVCKFYLNGTLQNIGSGANPSSYPSTSFTSTQSVGISTVTIGSGFTGYIDDTRITNGVARYTTNFTAPVTSFRIK
jgi:hypothetical protein